VTHKLASHANSKVTVSARLTFLSLLYFSIIFLDIWQCDLPPQPRSWLFSWVNMCTIGWLYVSQFMMHCLHVAISATTIATAANKAMQIIPKNK